jgi:hypothetical protein
MVFSTPVGKECDVAIIRNGRKKSTRSGSLAGSIRKNKHLSAALQMRLGQIHPRRVIQTTTPPEQFAPVKSPQRRRLQLSLFELGGDPNCFHWRRSGDQNGHCRARPRPGAALTGVPCRQGGGRREPHGSDRHAERHSRSQVIKAKQERLPAE